MFSGPCVEPCVLFWRINSKKNFKNSKNSISMILDGEIPEWLAHVNSLLAIHYYRKNWVIFFVARTSEVGVVHHPRGPFILDAAFGDCGLVGH